MAALASASALLFPLTAQANWSSWQNLGGETLYSGPAASLTAVQFYKQVYAVNSAGEIVANGIKTSMGSAVGSPSAIVARPDEFPSTFEDEVYYRGTDNKVRFFDWTGNCHFGRCDWRAGANGTIPGTVTSSPAAVLLNPGRVDLFARGANQELRHTFQEGKLTDPWVSWENLGGTFLDHPTAVAWQGYHRLDVFVRGLDNHLWQKSWTDTQGWSIWWDLGGTLTSAPSAIVFNDGRLDIFAKSTSDTLIHKIWTAGGGWTGWEDLGGRFKYSPSAVGNSGGIQVYVTGSTAQLEVLTWS
jgi:hypothetical protein